MLDRKLIGCEDRCVLFSPYAFGGTTTIRVTRRDNAATINPAQIYDFNLGCLYKLFNLTVHTRTPVPPFKAVICNLDILGLVITSRAEPLNDIAIAAVDEAFETIQELTHHLSIQEMDFELYNTTDAGSEPQLVAKGCLAFQDCGQIAGTGIDIYSPPSDPNVDKNITFIPQPHLPSLSLSAFADTIIIFYRALITRILSLPLSASLTMPAEPPILRDSPLHATQLWQSNHYNILRVVFAQSWFRRYNSTLPDVAEIVQFHFRQKLVDGSLRNGARGYFDKKVKGRCRWL
ncbi:MAG: hypothetical protein L6R37_008440 [Teloschistes peruensis]|nr:MAG: hypothetical protein L6R37_008440 [Teloschistes peruensis]